MAARPPLAAPSTEAFDAYFRRADLDRDDRISGAEAVAFLQGSNLPRQTLAQIWMHADQNRIGYLARPEFYNLLRLVTVAQSGRALTPDIVKAALYGPAAAKIPAPQINPVASAAQVNPTAASMAQPNSAARPAQMGVVGPSRPQNPGNRPMPPLTNMGMSQQSFPSLGSHAMRPSQVPASAAPVALNGAGNMLPVVGSVGGSQLPLLNSPAGSTDWTGIRTSGSVVVGASQPPSLGLPSVGPISSVNQSVQGPAALSKASVTSSPLQSPQVPLSAVPLKPQDAYSELASNNSKALVVSGYGFPSETDFGGDVFSATKSKQDLAISISSASGSSISTNITPELQSSMNPGYTQNSSTVSSVSSHMQSRQSFGMQNQQATTQNSLGLTTPNVSAGSSVAQSQVPWPKVTQSDIQKYTAVFVEVDKDKDGKITGQEARNLFLSWRLPREVLRQVWDLSDQDNDSMLSLREFCIALYLMERHREGCPLPSVLPNSLRYDETLLRATSQPSASSGGSAWRPNPGLSHQGVSGPRNVISASSMKQSTQSPVPSQNDLDVEPLKQKSKVPVLEKHLVDQLSEEEQTSLNSKFQEATDADKKVEELEKDILDAKEKVEYYRARMQELVLYKSRCDNRLNEIMERASGDKREVESLSRKYEDKCRQLGDVASKLTIEEATFRDVQEKKLELYNAIAKMEQGRTADGMLQNRAEQIQSDLEELVKSLNERCKQYGLRAKPTTLVELPFGWQAGIQEGAADWDEEWDRFDDDGFGVIKELTIEVEKVVTPEKIKDPVVSSVVPSVNEAVTESSSSHMNGEVEKPSMNGEPISKPESAIAQSEDESARSPLGSPAVSTSESHSEELISSKFGMHDHSSRTGENHGDHSAVDSSVSGDKYADEPSWGTNFDASDDADSTWGFSTINTKEKDDERDSGVNSFFGLGFDSGLNPLRISSPSAASVAGGRDRGPFFDSVPSTPAFSYSFSPKFSDGQIEDHAFDSMSRYDSFSTSDAGAGAFPKSLARFDSIRSNSDSDFFPQEGFGRFTSFGTTESSLFPPQDSFNQRESFSRFDSFSSSVDGGLFSQQRDPAHARFDSFSSSVDGGGLFSQQRDPALARFDSFSSTADHGTGGGFTSFDEVDPFGSTGPFRASESHSPAKGKDSWSAF